MYMYVYILYITINIYKYINIYIYTWCIFDIRNHAWNIDDSIYRVMWIEIDLVDYKNARTYTRNKEKKNILWIISRDAMYNHGLL